MKEKLWIIEKGDMPIVAAAIHDGHRVRSELEGLYAIDEEERLREEDPYTAFWTTVVPNRVVVHISRFEVDMNRPREHAVYLEPEDAWGLKVWRERPSDAMIARSLAEYDAFYADMESFLSEIRDRYGRFVVLDIHSYNYRREGPDGPEADPHTHPEINLGTGTITDYALWKPLIDRFVGDVKRFDYQGSSLDIRENIKFTGGYFARWIHQKFGDSACVLSVEFKKTFMDEWSGEADPEKLELNRRLLESTIPDLLEEIEKVGGRK